MWPYWIMFFIPAMVAYTSKPLRNIRLDGARRIKVDAAWLLVMLAIAFLIGFRDRVGGDWFNYFNYLFRAQNMSVAEALQRSDPGYELLNVLSVQIGLGIVGVNLFCGFFFALGLVLYCRSMPRPWLALAVAIPYMTVVVSMGYSRQGVALGFALIGLVALGRERFLWFVFWIVVAAAFHLSAVLLISIALLTLNFRKIHNLPVLLLVVPLMYSAFLEGRTVRLVEQYIDAEMASGGAFLRLLMNVVPAILFLKYRKRLAIAAGERRLYAVMALMAVVSFLALIGGLIPSTALDRTALYLLPLQVYVFSHLPDALGKQGGLNQAIVFGILAFYAIVLFVWLNFGTFSRWWLPYRMFPPLDIFEAVQQRR
jgi:hypothetical protein